MKSRLSRAAADLPPGSFSFIMATGIVSLAVSQQGAELVARVLFGVNALAYAVLAVLLILRGALFPRDLFADMTTPSRAPGLFTVTAGTCILGIQFLRLSGNVPVAAAFWSAGLSFWAVLGYTFFFSVIVRRDKSDGETELNGEWLLFVVGTQSLAILTILLGSAPGPWQEHRALTAASLHLAGVALYFGLAVMVLRRMLFLDMPPEKFTPPYWITMGAAAISTLAGAELMASAGPGSPLAGVLPALRWSTLLLWAVTTWWIPLILALNVWRYGSRRFPISYDVQHWSMVFPLGMYAVSSFEPVKAALLTPLVAISRVFAAIALAAWVVVIPGMIAGLLGKRKHISHS